MDINKFFRVIGAPALVIIGLLFIAIGGKDIYQGFFSQGEKPDAAVQEALAKSQDVREYEDSRTGVRFMYPKSWESKPIQNGTSFSTLDDAVNVRVSVDDFSAEEGEMTAERYRDLTRIQLGSVEKEASVKYTVKDEGTTTIAALPAYEWTYTLKVKDVTVSGAQVWFVKDKKVFVMTFSVPEQLFDTFYSVYQRMVESITLP
jgi:hypothetical protein